MWNVDRPRRAVFKMHSRKTEALNLFWSLFPCWELMAEMTASGSATTRFLFFFFRFPPCNTTIKATMWLFQKQSPCSDVTKQQTKALLNAQLQVIPKYLSWYHCRLTDCGSNNSAALWHDSGIKQNARSRVKWQKLLALWNATAVQTNCELARFKPFSFRHKRGQSFFMGQLRTPVLYPEAAGTVLAGISVSPTQSATVHISKHDGKRRIQIQHCHYLILSSFAFSSVTLISPTMKSTERSIHAKPGSMRRWRRMVKLVNSRQCLTSQLNNKTSTCFWLDEQQAGVSACSTGLELDR